MSIISIIVAILLFSVIIIFHELGHFLLAKLNGVQVNEFCLGLGPTLFGVTIGETKYSLKLLPFGGACMMEGEDEGSDNERAFNNKSVWARISVVFAGPFFNFIMAFIFSFIIIMAVGYDKPVLSAVSEGYAAEEAGLMAGDEILKMDNYRIHFYSEISVYATFHEGEAVEVTYQRDGVQYTTTLVPIYSEEYGRYLYGFVSSGNFAADSIPQALSLAVYEVRYWIYTTFQSLRLLVTGGYGLDAMSGPVGIVKTVGDTYEQSAKTDGLFYAFLNMLNWGVLLSANLGVMNLLPLPALDGGRLVFLIVEAIRRKRIDPDKEGYVHLVGIVLLLLLMVVVMFNDIRKLFLGLI